MRQQPKFETEEERYRKPHKSSLRFCNKTKGEHNWVEADLPNTKYPHFTGKWEKWSWSKEWARWRLFICSKCNKQDIRVEHRDEETKSYEKK